MKAILQQLPRILSSLKSASGILLPLLLIGVFLGGWWIGRPAKKATDTAAKGESQTKWTCSMHPTVRQDGPGLCPICQMDLIPVSAAAVGGFRDVILTPDAVARLDIRVAPVLRQAATNRLRFLGRVAPDETRVSTTTARMDGRLDRLFIDYTGITVRKGDHLAEIYSPDLYIAQEELIQAKRALATNPDRTRKALYRATSEKLRLLGIGPEQIAAIEQQEEPTDHLTLNARQDGIVLKLHKREGDYVKEGEPLYSLADLSKVWVFLEAYEDDLAWLRFAQNVEFHADALPGQTFTGIISFIDPILDEARRIARIRVNVPNPDRALKPGMFIRGEVQSVLAGDRVMNPALAGKWISPMHPEIMKDAPGKCDICGMALVKAEELGFTTEGEPGALPLLVPVSAVLRTGDRAVVYRRLGSDEGITFEGREIILGPRAGHHFVVESGLREGDLVVTRGAFKLDSELQIQARTAMMLDGQQIDESAGIDVPPKITGAWKPVLRILARAQRALGDEEQFARDLQQARQVVSTITPEFLPEDYEPLWRESSMKLENLFASTRKEGQKHGPAVAWEELLRLLPKFAALGGLAWQLPELKALPPAQLAEINTALDAYVVVVDLLAHDKAKEALAAAAELAKTLQAASVEKVSETASGIAAATDEKALRAALKTVTDTLRPIIREAGNDQLGQLYLVHCPMAFDSAGADWFSRKSVVENPYYGSKMFSCGDVTETLSLPPGMPGEMPMKDGVDHSGHKHKP